MRLVLSSAAAPEAVLAELASAARRRGLRGVELVHGDAHGFPADTAEDSAAVIAELRGRQVELAAVVFHDLGTAQSYAQAIPASAALVVPAAEALAFPQLLAALRSTGKRPVLAFTDPEQLLDEVGSLAAQGLECAWEVLPERGHARAAAAVLAAAGARLRHVRLRGGGPEAAAQEGMGVGDLMRDLALAGYDGTIALAPSAHRYRVIWNTWLGRRGGWGCGGKSRTHPALPTLTRELQ